MNHIDHFDIKYWGNEFSYDFVQKPKGRSIKKKLAIVASFIVILAIIPSAIFGITKTTSNQKSHATVSKIITPVAKKAPEGAQIALATPGQDSVKKGDSYWRIAKRNCGSGKYFLTIQDLNSNKPLFIGESVKIACTL